MMIYEEYEKKVFDWLMAKHEQNPEFTFSVRQVASKGARKDYFIGTKKSNYFQTTFWDIHVAYPGASGDLINLVFKFTNTGYRFRFEFNQTKDPHNEQNRAALELIKAAKEDIKQLDEDNFYASPETNKSEYYHLKSPKRSYEKVEDMFVDLEEILPQLISIVDSRIDEIKEEYPKMHAHRITKDEFEDLIKKMERRFEKYSDTEEEEKADEMDAIEAPKKQTFEPPLNQILYGPPGTGKTYKTLNHALAILENDKRYLDDEDYKREHLHLQFNEYKKNRQVRFVTFHPSFTYEDFVEGIKPDLTTREEGEGTDVSYIIEDGIFKDICNSASESKKLKSKKVGGRPLMPEEFFKSNGYHKISLGNSNRSEDDIIYDYCMKHDLISIGFLNDVDCTGADSLDEIRARATEKGYDSTHFGIDAMHRFKNWMKEDQVVFVSEGLSKIRAVGLVKKKGDEGYFYDPNSELPYSHFRYVEWILKDVEIPILDIYHRKLSQQTIYMIGKEHINLDYFTVQEEDENEEKRFVLIIDEINRGNIPSIFGELITLLEPDKRANGKEATSVTLPYSKKTFEVPSNLFVIGTMNTADRSVEALDVALRRRFNFTPTYPEPSKISQPDELDVNLTEMLRVINDRIEYLIDKDHTIGHSYFMNVTESDEPELELKKIFTNKVLPLLDEYFYGQPDKIGLVLGEDFVKVKRDASQSGTLFANNFKSQDPPADRIVYTLEDPMSFHSCEPFRKIYE